MSAMLIFYVTTINIMAFSIMYIDKRKAIAHQYRISEQKLWLLALMGGSIGSWLGMQLFPHKTRHAGFKYGIPVLVVLHIIVIFLVSSQ